MSKEEIINSLNIYCKNRNNMKKEAKTVFVKVSVQDSLPPAETHNGKPELYTVTVIGITKYDFIKGYFDIHLKQFREVCDDGDDVLNEDVTHWLKEVPINTLIGVENVSDEEIEKEANWRFTSGHGATDEYAASIFISAAGWMRDKIAAQRTNVERSVANADAMENKSLDNNINTLQGTLALDQAWPLRDIINKLVEASEILLNKKDYDGHGWEEISYAVKKAKEIAKQLSGTIDQPVTKQEDKRNS